MTNKLFTKLLPLKLAAKTLITLAVILPAAPSVASAVPWDSRDCERFYPNRIPTECFPIKPFSPFPSPFPQPTFPRPLRW